MKKPIIKLFDKIILTLLGFFGMFTACKHESDCSAPYFTDSYPYSDSTVMVEYGPMAQDFEIKGKITNKANSKPIAGIRIISKTTKNKGDTIYTNSEGKYVYRRIGIPYFVPEGLAFYFTVEDIDGEANGGDFETKEIEVIVKSSDQVERCEVGLNRYEKTQNIKLEKKN